MGRSVAVKTPAAFQNANKINGFVHISYRTELIRGLAFILTSQPVIRIRGILGATTIR